MGQRVIDNESNSIIKAEVRLNLRAAMNAPEGQAGDFILDSYWLFGNAGLGLPELLEYAEEQAAGYIVDWSIFKALVERTVAERLTYDERREASKARAHEVVKSFAESERAIFAEALKNGTLTESEVEQFISQGLYDAIDDLESETPTEAIETN